MVAGSIRRWRSCYQYTLLFAWEDVLGIVEPAWKLTVHMIESLKRVALGFVRCTLLGYHMRGLEYRLELSRTLSLSGESVLDLEDNKHEP